MTRRRPLPWARASCRWVACGGGIYGGGAGAAAVVATTRQRRPPGRPRLRRPPNERALGGAPTSDRAWALPPGVGRLVISEEPHCRPQGAPIPPTHSFTFKARLQRLKRAFRSENAPMLGRHPPKAALEDWRDGLPPAAQLERCLQEIRRVAPVAASLDVRGQAAWRRADGSVDEARAPKGAGPGCCSRGGASLQEERGGARVRRPLSCVNGARKGFALRIVPRPCQHQTGPSALRGRGGASNRMEGACSGPPSLPPPPTSAAAPPASHHQSCLAALRSALGAAARPLTPQLARATVRPPTPRLERAAPRLLTPQLARAARRATTAMVLVPAAPATRRRAKPQQRAQAAAAAARRPRHQATATAAAAPGRRRRQARAAARAPGRLRAARARKTSRERRGPSRSGEVG
jgi:hypothetical protein